MQAKHREAVFRIARLAPIFVAVSMLASCGGDGGGNDEPPAPPPLPTNSNLLIGTPHGDLAPYLTERLGLVSTPENASGSADGLGDVLLLSAPNGLSAAHASLPTLKNAFEQGKAVALLHADEGEISTLLMALGMDMDYPPPDDGTPYELFAVRRAGGDTHFFVTLGGGEPEDNPTSYQIHEEEVPTTMPEVDESVAQGVRADNFARWVEEMKEKAQAKADTPAAKDETTSLRDLAETFFHDVDLSDMGQSFVIRYAINAVHSFTNDLDFYFVTQSASLNPKPSGLRKWIWRGSCATYFRWQADGQLIESNEPAQVGHMRHYIFKNYWGADPGNTLPLDPNHHSPPTTRPRQRITSSVSQTTGGSLGIDIKGLGATISSGVTYSNSVTFEIRDVAIDNQAGTDGGKHLAAWQYTFANPATVKELFCYWAMNDAPELSYTTFQPTNQWLWTVPSAFSDTQKNGFKAEFNWTNGLSVAGRPPIHLKWLGRTKVFWVPIEAIRPPLLATDEAQLNFTKVGQFKPVKLISARDWTATSDADWLSIDEKSGSKTGKNGIELRIMVEPNDSGAYRKGYITLRSADGKHVKVIEAFQGQY